MAGVLGVAGHKADVVIAGHGAQQVEQVGEIDLLLQPLTVAVHVLPQQGDLLIARFHKVAELGKDIAGLAALLAAADVGHDAVGAEVIAAVHDGQPCAELALAPDGDVLHDDRTLCGVQQHPLMLLQFLGDQLRQGVDAVHAEHQIHIGVALAQLSTTCFWLAMQPHSPMMRPGFFSLRPFSAPTLPNTRCSACSRTAQVLNKIRSASSAYRTGRSRYPPARL